MMRKYLFLCFLLALFLIPVCVSAQPINTAKLKTIRLPQFPVKGLVWKGQSVQNTNWNKICETPDGKIWFCGGDHWGSDGVPGSLEKGDRYERLWGFGNTTVCSYDPRTDEVRVAFELDRASSLFSNIETPGHGKIHSNIVCDSEGNLITAGYMGSSYVHEYTQAYYPRSYPGAAVIKYSPETGDIDYFGIPYPHGGIVALYYDEKRNMLNGLTVDRAKFWRMNMSTMELFHYESMGRMSRLTDRVREMIMDRNGVCYLANDVGGLTRIDPDTETITDLDLTIPGELKDFRASVVSSDNVVYCISTDGFIWSYTPAAGRLDSITHILGNPRQPHYTPNIALDEELQRLYFLAGNHGGAVLEEALEVLTILDLRTKRLYRAGKVEGLEGCFGALVARDHSVYFSCFGQIFTQNGVETDKNGRSVTRPYLLKYEPPDDLNELE